jgi:hypothetical protein
LAIGQERGSRIAVLAGNSENVHALIGP